MTSCSRPRIRHTEDSLAVGFDEPGDPSAAGLRAALSVETWSVIAGDAWKGLRNGSYGDRHLIL